LVKKVKQKTSINIGRLIFRKLHKQLGGKVRLFAIVSTCLVFSWGLFRTNWRNGRAFLFSNCHSSHIWCWSVRIEKYIHSTFWAFYPLYCRFPEFISCWVLGHSLAFKNPGPHSKQTCLFCLLLLGYWAYLLLVSVASS